MWKLGVAGWQVLLAIPGGILLYVAIELTIMALLAWNYFTGHPETWQEFSQDLTIRGYDLADYDWHAVTNLLVARFDFVQEVARVRRWLVSILVCLIVLTILFTIMVVMGWVLLFYALICGVLVVSWIVGKFKNRRRIPAAPVRPQFRRNVGSHRVYVLIIVGGLFALLLAIAGFAMLMSETSYWQAQAAQYKSEITATNAPTGTVGALRTQVSALQGKLAAAEYVSGTLAYSLTIASGELEKSQANYGLLYSTWQTATNKVDELTGQLSNANYYSETNGSKLAKSLSAQQTAEKDAADLRSTLTITNAKTVNDLKRELGAATTMSNTNGSKFQAAQSTLDKQTPLYIQCTQVDLPAAKQQNKGLQALLDYVNALNAALLKKK